MRAMLASLLLMVTVAAPGCISLKQRAQSYDECAAAKECTVSGMATARPAEHGWMVQVDLPEGRCVSVSVPPRDLKRLRRSGPRPATFTGRVFPDPSAHFDPSGEEIVFLAVEGRRIGLGLCGDFYLYVPG